MKAEPEPTPAQKVGMRPARNPPINTPIPSTRAKAIMAPTKTEIGLYLEASVKVASWVLSPSSEMAIIPKEAIKGA